MSRLVMTGKSGGERYLDIGRNCSIVTEKLRKNTEVVFLWSFSLKNTVCLYLLSERLYTRNKKGPASVFVHIQTALGQDLPFFIQNDSALSGG